jgi:hypothetical protein
MGRRNSILLEGIVWEGCECCVESIDIERAEWEEGVVGPY